MIFLSKGRTNLRPVIRTEHDLSLAISENVMTSHASNPDETGGRSNALNRTVRDETQSGHAGISTRQVPTKSGPGSSPTVVFRYPSIASRMLDSNVGKSGACE